MQNIIILRINSHLGLDTCQICKRTRLHKATGIFEAPRQRQYGKLPYSRRALCSAHTHDRQLVSVAILSLGMDIKIICIARSLNKTEWFYLLMVWLLRSIHL